MWDASKFRELVSGRRRGAGPALVRGMLAAASIPYGWAVAARNLAYDRGWKRAERVDVPVVSIGNLTAGGTGKTPLAAWIVRRLEAAGVRVVLISRGYGASEQGGRLNDEALELADRLPRLVHLQQADRVAAARRAIADHGADLLLLDDAFQHRRLARDLDVVLLDALEPFGYDRLLPRGLLREPPSSLRRAQVAGLSRADLVTEERREELRRTVAARAPQADWIELAHEPVALRRSSGAERPWQTLSGLRVAAFAGIGNPAGFRRSLERLGLQVVAWREFPDHHAYAAADLEELQRWTARHSPDVVLCTHKDLVKLRVEQLADRPLEALLVETRFLRGEAEFLTRLTALTSGRASSK